MPTDGNPKDTTVLAVLDRLPDLCARHFDESKRDDGRHMVDIGCGATLHNAFTFSRYFAKITMADWNRKALEMLQQWMDNQSMGFDWGPYSRLVADSEGVGLCSPVVHAKVWNSC